MTDFIDSLTVIVNRKPIKHVYFRLNAQGEIEVSAPLQYPEAQLKILIKQRSSWFEKKYRQRQSLQLAASDTQYMRLWGDEYTVVHEHCKKPHIFIEDSICRMHSPKDWADEHREKLTVEFYRSQLMPRVADYVEQYSPIIGVEVKEIRSKIMKTRWGTCNINKQRLWFSVALAKYPLKCCEYVVVHEMTHLLERYHNKRFYNLVEQAMPDWKQWHDYLRSPPW